ncbi:MAG: peptidoglycan editing factor PgeF [Candidatus Saccharicenans sp.]
MSEKKNYLTIEKLNQIPWLVHGFGLAGFEVSQLKKEPSLKSFYPVELSQQHSAKVFFIKKILSSKLVGDGLITAAPGLLLLIKTADCLPVLLIDLEHQAIAAVHCGWRGTYQKIIEKTLKQMNKIFGSQPEKILAALGPCVEQNCYEVGPEVQKAFFRAGFPLDSIFRPAQQVNKFFLDLRAANFWLLTKVIGLPEENISQINLCTFCRPELLSYRRQPLKEERLINFIGIKK